MRDPQSIPLNEDARLIPVWSMIAAGIAFVVVEYYWWFILPATRHHPPAPLGLRIYFNLSWGLLAALYFLMVGYVSRDAPRRSMSTRFWMMICFVLPSGFVFSPETSDHVSMRGLRDACAERVSFLSAMQLSADGELRQLLPVGADHGSVLHAVRT